MITDTAEILLERLVPPHATTPLKWEDRGILGPMPRSEYDAIPALSCSVLKKWITYGSLPAKFNWWLKHRWDDTDTTDSLALGSALDCLLLDPKHFADGFEVLTKDGPKKVTAAHRKQFAPKTVISFSQWEACAEMVKSLMTSPQTSFGEDFAHTAKTVVCAELFGGAPFKAEYDLWSEQTDGIQDLKTARDAAPQAFGKAGIDFGYDLQASLYLLIARAIGFDKKCFNFVVVENQEPWTTKVYRFRPFENPKHADIFAACTAKLKEATMTLLIASENRFVEDDTWEDITFPSWAVSNARKSTLELE